MRLVLFAFLLIFPTSRAVAQLQPIGEGCASPRGLIPQISLREQPIVGSTVELQVRTGQAGSSVLAFLGFSISKWNNLQLPLSLRNFGFPGCTLFVSLDQTFAAVADNQGVARISQSTRGLPVNAGAFAQVLVSGRNSNGAGRWFGFSEAAAVFLEAAPQKHAIAVLPDTQKYSQFSSNIRNFDAQTDWIVRNKTARNLVFVSHEGDIVQNGARGSSRNSTEWGRADRAMDKLDGDLSKNRDGLIPYSAVIGNHDYDIVNNKATSSRYAQFFGPRRYAGRSWYLGASPNGENHAQVIKVGKLNYLHLGIEWRPNDSAIVWAQSMLHKCATWPCVLTTHDYLSIGLPAVRRTFGRTSSSGGTNSGEDLYRKLIEPSPQIFLVLCGHVFGEGRLRSVTALNQPVQQWLADYQTDPNGGNGWLRVLDFLPQNDQIRVQTLSPTYVPGSTLGLDRNRQATSNFTVTHDFYAHRAFLESHRVLHFREGQNFGTGTYTGTTDTYIGNGSSGGTLPNVSYGNAGDVRCDGDADREQGLLGFGNLLGKTPGKIPPRTVIRQAILTLTTEGSSAQSTNGGRFYRMTKAWNESSTFNSLGSGVQIGSESLGFFETDSRGQVGTTGTRSFDVTRAVQAWVNGETNHGWLIQAGGRDRWSWRSSEWGTVAERPMLTVIY